MNELEIKKKAASPKKVQNIVFGVILVLLFLLVCRVFEPFFTVLLWSTVLFVIINPLHNKIVKRFNLTTKKGKLIKNFFAGLFALGTAVIVLIPILFVMSQFLRQIMELVQILRDTFYRKPDFLQEIFIRFSDFISNISSNQISITPDEIQRRLLSALNGGINNILLFSRSIALNISSFIISLVFMVFCLFFFYLDGALLANLFLNLIPIRHDYISKLVTKFKDITKNLFLGYIIVALIQATLAYIIYSIFKVNGALVFACLTFICVFIPMLGGAIIWLPLGAARIISGDLAGGILFLVLSSVFISLLDNVLKPLFLQDRIQLHPLIIFFSIMGGLKVFGFNGIVLGPMIVILFLTVLDMFLTEHNIEHTQTKFTGDT
ncbi:AI-2E family transporter [Spirochaetia bacterium]|nr:AI-2E family transporter [Spirochaetia bacterium]